MRLAALCDALRHEPGGEGSADRVYMSDESWSEEGEAAAERREGSRKDSDVVFGHK